MPGMLAETAEIGLRRKHPVHRSDHGWRAAARSVLLQPGRGKIAFQILRRDLEQARLGTPEAVDRLLRVAHQEDAGPVPGRAIGRQPGLHDLPLQGVGVLKLVQQDVLVAAIQLVLHVFRILAAAQELEHAPFHIGEIQHLARFLEPLVGREQGRAAKQAVTVEAVGRLRGQTIAGLEYRAKQICWCNSSRRASHPPPGAWPVWRTDCEHAACPSW